MKAIAHGPGLPGTSALSAARSFVSDVLASLAAATAVATAIDNHRRPSESDLRQLGMEGATFNLNF